MKLLKLVLATMEVVRQAQVLFAERAHPRINSGQTEDPQESTQTASSNRRKRR